MKNKQAILLLLPPFFLEKLQQLESECDRLCWDLSIAKVFSILNQLFISSWDFHLITSM
jgi:hypothetical protein